MSKFCTEKETERYLERETRILELPNGEKVPVTVFNLTWVAFDSMIKTKAFTAERLVELSYSWFKRENKHDFTTYFENMVACAFREVKAKRYGRNS